jgi:PPM family protein phosphatase
VAEFNNIEYASRTDVGVRRSHNQDAHVLMPATDSEQWLQRGHVFLVADGMGAHAVGELASKMAVDNIPHIYSKYAREGAVPALRKAFVEANVTIHTRGRQNREFHGMGTTASALILRPEGAWIGHVGDSRVYRIRGGAIEQLSFDHSLIWELARRQQKRPEEMQGIPPNVIVRSLGPEPLVQVDVAGPHDVLPGDIYLLCSDGLSGQVTDREIGAVVSALTPEEACRFLVHLANLQGGPDNITVVIVRIAGTPPELANGSTNSVPVQPLLPRVRPLQRRLAAILRRLPWALVLLVSGVLLAILAVAMVSQQMTGYVAVFILACLALFGGLIGLMVQNFRESRPATEEEESHEACVYRHVPCTIDAPLLQRLVQATQSIETDIHEKGWSFDQTPYQDHLGQVKRAVAEGRERDAFSEQCRALMALMDVVQDKRGGGGESFRPLWDRPL